MTENEYIKFMDVLKEISVTSLRIEKLLAHIIEKAESAAEECEHTN